MALLHGIFVFASMVLLLPTSSLHWPFVSRQQQQQQQQQRRTYPWQLQMSATSESEPEPALKASHSIVVGKNGEYFCSKCGERGKFSSFCVPATSELLAAYQEKQKDRKAAHELELAREKAAIGLEIVREEAANRLEVVKEKAAIGLEVVRGKSAHELEVARQKSAHELEVARQKSAIGLEVVRQRSSLKEKNLQNLTSLLIAGSLLLTASLSSQSVAAWFRTKALPAFKKVQPVMNVLAGYAAIVSSYISYCLHRIASSLSRFG